MSYPRNSNWMGWTECLAQHYELHLFMLQGVTALNLKGNLYFQEVYLLSLTSTYFEYELNLLPTKIGCKIVL